MLAGVAFQPARHTCTWACAADVGMTASTNLSGLSLVCVTASSAEVKQSPQDYTILRHQMHHVAKPRVHERSVVEIES